MSVEVRHFENGNIKSIAIKNERGYFHNTEGPAYQLWHNNGQEVYRVHYVNGKVHSTEGPSVQEWYDNGQEMCRAYYVNGKAHNTEGPYLQWWYKNGQEESRMYCIKGMFLSKEEWEKKVNSVTVECEGKTVTISRESAKALNLI